MAPTLFCISDKENRSKNVSNIHNVILFRILVNIAIDMEFLAHVFHEWR